MYAYLKMHSHRKKISVRVCMGRKLVVLVVLLEELKVKMSAVKMIAQIIQMLHVVLINMSLVPVDIFHLTTVTLCTINPDTRLSRIQGAE